MGRFAYALVVAAGVCVHTGCTGLRPPSLADRFLHSPELKHDAGRQEREAPPSPTLEEAMGKLRRMMAEARPEPKDGSRALTLEAQDPALRAALAIATALPTPQHYVNVALAYQQHRLLDKAHHYYSAALKSDPTLAEAHEGLARTWRDWGLPHLAIRDAHRAIYYAPRSASARNTLGTILQALGQQTQARLAYTKTLALDPRAGYAYNNLCYLSLTERRRDLAARECAEAIRIDPTLAAAHANLGLLYAAAGELNRARQAFEAAGSMSSSAYRMGVVLMAHGRYADAAGEFERARILDPGFGLAARRERQARRLAATTSSETKGTSHGRDR